MPLLGSLRKSQPYQVPITIPISCITLFASRFPLPHFILAVLFALSFPISSSLSRLPYPVVMAESKRTKGSFQGFSTLDSPSILSKLINNDAIERPTGVSNESLNNFDEDGSGIFRYLLDESLKDAWDRLLRIRASYVPQYQIEDYLKSFYIGLPASFKQVLDSILKEVFLKGMLYIPMKK